MRWTSLPWSHPRALLAPIAVILVSALAVPPAALGAVAHVVSPGESLTSVAATDGLTVGQLAAANALSPESELIAGSTLLIPSQTAEAGPIEGASPEASPTSVIGSEVEGGFYTVQPGDTLSAIAARAGLSVSELAAFNGLDPNGVLLSGTALRLPAAAGEFATASGESGASSQPEETTIEAAPPAEGAPYPTPEIVTPSEVGSIAAANEVPAPLAAAIADQESGFNNDLVSSAGARGVMQILPETWDWISSTLAGPPPLSPASAVDNVRGGVLMLRDLLEATAGDPSLAAAGYYQGLSSVTNDGEYPATQQYVDDVMALERQFGGE